MSLAELIAKIRDVRAVITQGGPSVLDRVADVAEQIAELSRAASAYLSSLNQPPVVESAGPVKKGEEKAASDPAEYKTGIKELQKTCEELRRFATQPTSALSLKAKGRKKTPPVLPPKTQTHLAQILLEVSEGLRDGLVEHPPQ